MKKEIMAMENRAKAEREKERERGVLREHRRKEKEAVKQGKRPFFLKKSEQKKRALVDKFESMKGKEREKAMKKKRKKESEKERRNMPGERRSIET